MQLEGLTGSPLVDFGFLFARLLVGLLMAASPVWRPCPN